MASFVLVCAGLLMAFWGFPLPWPAVGLLLIAFVLMVLSPLPAMPASWRHADWLDRHLVHMLRREQARLIWQARWRQWRTRDIKGLCSPLPPPLVTRPWGDALLALAPPTPPDQGLGVPVRGGATSRAQVPSSVPD